MLKFFCKKLIIILCFTCFCASVNAANNSAKLKNLLNQITSVKTDIKQKEKRQISVKQQLKDLKVRTKILETSYRITIKKLKIQKNVLIKLNNNQAKQQSKLQETRQVFFAQMRAAYQIEQSNYIKIIFSKENYTNPDLFLEYNKHIFAARLLQMHNIKKILERIRSNKQQIKKQTKILENLENKQQQQKKELVQAQQEHNKILNSLKNKISSQKQKLEQLISAKNNLEKLIIRLSRQRQTVAIAPKLMSKLCQHFVWPTKGTVTVHFGSPIEQSSWSWSGIIITAPENQEVRAVSPGSIVYADWFTGYGLLLIIDHGSGYMSLYGHNSGFRKKLNDQVESNEIVSMVGKSGREEPGLYFAIRYNGKPVNPEKWCT